VVVLTPLCKTISGKDITIFKLKTMREQEQERCKSRNVELMAHTIISFGPVFSYWLWTGVAVAI
jgi:hypothetical protein